MFATQPGRELGIEGLEINIEVRWPGKSIEDRHPRVMSCAGLRAFAEFFNRQVATRVVGQTFCSRFSRLSYAPSTG